MGGFGFGGGGGGLRPGGIGGLGLGGLLVILILSWVLGGNPLSLLSPDSGVDPYATEPGPTGAPTDTTGKFVSSILGDTEDFWSRYFADRGSTYPVPTLVLFSDSTPSACGMGAAAMGPFYCPRDRKVYLDTSFFRDLGQRFGAPGDFAQAYVIAHEVAHHVQNTLGLLSSGGGNAQSVRQELQADCLAGMWGRSAATRDLLEPGDVEEGLRAAAAIGDDRLQRATQGRVVPESFTHGTSEQRVNAVRTGLNSTELSGCGAR
jgi:predicted metalloprotease